MADFVHLHVHTQYSLLDGALKIPDLMKRVKETGMSAVAMTDHGNMYGAVDFQKAASKKGVKSIIGCEMYFTKEAYDLPAEDKTELKSYHLTMLAMNHQGYKNLMFLNSMAWLHGVHPRTGIPLRAVLAAPRGDHRPLGGSWRRDQPGVAVGQPG